MTCWKQWGEYAGESCECGLRVCRCYHLLPSLIVDVDDGVYWGERTVSPAWRMCTGVGRYEVCGCTTWWSAQKRSSRPLLRGVGQCLTNLVSVFWVGSKLFRALREANERTSFLFYVCVCVLKQTLNWVEVDSIWVHIDTGLILTRL